LLDGKEICDLAFGLQNNYRTAAFLNLRAACTGLVHKLADLLGNSGVTESCLACRKFHCNGQEFGFVALDVSPQECNEVARRAHNLDNFTFYLFQQTEVKRKSTLERRRKLGTAFYGFLGLLLSYSLARKYVAAHWAFLATLGIWGASSVPVYMYFNPAWSHAQSAFAVALLSADFRRYFFKRKGLMQQIEQRDIQQLEKNPPPS
jgi:hypothetical protein